MDELLTTAERVALRVMEEMRRQHVGPGRLARRVGWPEGHLMMRLGQVMPGFFKGGRVPLARLEIVALADALRVPVGQLLGEDQLVLPAADLALAVAS
jgi:hypothetical protein